MSKKIDVLGVCVDNYTVRESLMRLDTYLGSTVLNIIETVTMEQLIAAGENAAIKDCLEQADLCIIGDYEILSETGNASAWRMREVRDQDFFRELLKRVARSRKRVFLFAETEAEMERMLEFLTEQEERFVVAGSYAIESCAGDKDAIVNEINGATPDVVLSALDSPDEEEFVLSYKEKIGAGIWYGIGPVLHRQQKNKVGSTLKRLALRGRLRHSMTKYQNKDRK